MAQPNQVSFGLQSLVAPDLQTQTQQIQRQQALIDALRQQSITPLESQTVSGAGPSQVVKTSPFQGLAKLGQAYFASKMQDANDQSQTGLNQEYAKRLASALNGGTSAPTEAAPGQLGSGMMGAVPPPDGLPVVPQSGLQSPQQAAGGNNNFTLPNLLRGQVISTIGGDPAASAYWGQFAPTDMQKNDRYLGINQDQSRATEIAKRLKEGYIPPTSLRPGGIAAFPNGSMEQLPTAIEGSQAVKNPDGSWSYRPMQGATEGIQAAAAAALRGKNQQTLAPKEMSPTLPNGQTIPTTISSAIDSSATPPAPQNTQSGLDLSKLDPATQQYLQKRDPQAFAAGVSRFNGAQPQATTPQGVGPAFGQEAGAVNAQKELSDKWQKLNSANEQAQTTNSYLENIATLAKKAAVGPQSDKIQLVNGLLSLVGNERAKDAATANSLMEKYQGQIVSRLGGQGGMATDAARGIISSAFPGSKMTENAIEEAKNNIVGANQMMKAKTTLLSPHANSRDPVAYSQKEIAFDQNADPRIWQWKGIQDPKAKAAFAASVLKQDPNFPKKIQALEKIGAF